MMKVFAAGVILMSIAANPAQAESCTKSRDHLLGNLGGDLVQPPQAYQGLFKVCLATMSMTNVKDAFVLRDGGIAVIPKQDSVAATAATLSKFCDAYPRSTLRFLSRKDLLQTNSVSRIVKMSSTGSTSCRKIKGNAPS
ncbi:MAG: hypothetical protein Q7V17_00165 [Afipia sp.]|nr:hypothetical protein [Afipia sp.]